MECISISVGQLFPDNSVEIVLYREGHTEGTGPLSNLAGAHDVPLMTPTGVTKLGQLVKVVST